MPWHRWLHAATEPRTTIKVKNVFVIGQRWAIALAVPMILPVLVAPAPALQLLTGVAEPSADMVAVLRLLLVATLLFVIGHSVTKRVLMMTGHHRIVCAITVAELALNAAVTVVGLVLTGSVVAAAVGTVVAATCLPLPIVLPLACRRPRCEPPDLLARGHPTRPCRRRSTATVVAIAWGLVGPTAHIGHLLLLSAAVGVATLVGWWRWAMNAELRARISTMLGRAVPFIAARGVSGSAA